MNSINQLKMLIVQSADLPTKGTKSLDNHKILMNPSNVQAEKNEATCLSRRFER